MGLWTHAFTIYRRCEICWLYKAIITILDNIVEPPKKNDEERLKKIEALGGSLAEYAIKDGRSMDEIMELESKAWEQAVVEKYGKDDV